VVVVVDVEVVGVEVDSAPTLACLGFSGRTYEDLVLIVIARLDETEKKINVNKVRSINFFMVVNLIN
jgi:hypothetical protein